MNTTETIAPATAEDIKRTAEQLRQWVAVARLDPESWVCVRLIHHDGRSRNRHCKADQLASQAEYLLRQNRGGFNIYAVVSPVIEGGTKGKDVLEANCLFIDKDDKVDAKSLDTLLEIAADHGVPPPSLCVRTSSETRHHLYWGLDAPIPADKLETVWRAYQEMLIGVHGSDDAVKGLPQLMRLPGFKNVKMGGKVAYEDLPDCAIVGDPLTDPDDRYSLRNFPTPAPDIRRNGVASHGAGTEQTLADIEDIDLRAAMESSSDGLNELGPDDVYAKPTLEYCVRCLKYLSPDCGYDDWYKVGMAIHSEWPNLEGFTVYDAWSKKSAEKYNAKVCGAKWESFEHRDDGVGFGTLVMMALDNGMPAELRHRETKAPVPHESPGSETEVKAGTTEGKTERVELPSNHASDIAEIVLRQLYWDKERDRPLIVHYAGQFYHWTGQSYERFAFDPHGVDEMGNAIRRYLRRATFPSGKKQELARLTVNVHLIKEVKQEMIARIRVVDSGQAVPCWLNSGHKIPANELFPCENGAVHFPTGALMEPDPDLFTTVRSPVTFDPAATDAPAFKGFLGTSLPDPASQQLFLEIAAYCLTRRRSLQCLFLFLGPTRAGKGIATGLLRRMMGTENVCGGDLSTLGNEHTLSGFVDKALVIFSDERSNRSSDYAVSALLKITGGDVLSINPKYLQPFSVVLPINVIIASNEIPNLRDRSGVLPHRFVPLKFPRSHLGEEDRKLGDKLQLEESAILNLIIAAAATLKARGRFLLPISSEVVLDDLKTAGSTVVAFVDEFCVLDKSESGWVLKDDLDRAYREVYCVDQGISAMSKNAFLKAINAAFSHHGVLSGDQKRKLADGTRPRVVEGLRLKSAQERMS